MADIQRDVAAEKDAAKAEVRRKIPQAPAKNRTVITMSGTAKISRKEYNDKGVLMHDHVSVRTFTADYDAENDTFKLREPKA